MTDPLHDQIDKRPTIARIARLAGVSRATVDRVLHNRAGVQPHTRRHVLAAAEAAGVPQAEKRRTDRHIDVIIPDQANAFLAELARHIDRQVHRIEGMIPRFHRPASVSEADMLATMKDVLPDAEAVALVGVDSHRLREAIRDLAERDVPVVTLSSDIRNAPRAAYAGIDNKAAGRLAGYLMGRLIARPDGKTALILGSRAYFGHEEREIGYRGLMRGDFNKMRIVDEREIHEDPDSAYRETLDLLDKHEELDGIYCIGAGQQGVARALVETGRARSVLFIAHGLSADTRDHLADGVLDVIIDDNAEAEARAAVDMLVAKLEGKSDLPRPSIPIVPVFRENLPAAS